MATALPALPRVLFVLDGTGPTGIETRISTLHAAARNLAPSDFRRNVPVLAAPLVDLLRDGPGAPVWRPVHNPDRSVSWNNPRHP
ncbi:hypothetical protein [Streptomyces sp. NPDC054834]